MPKSKSSSAARKRFTKLPSGKVKRAKAFRRHLLSKKSRSRKRFLRQGDYVNGSDMKRTRRLLN